MLLFNDYIEPLTLWLYDHPNLALLIAFTVSFSESLAIVGAIIPGSVTMTALGILAGSGVMRIDLTLLAAALGAIAGDSASYLLGSHFSERLTKIWPFSRYPNWLTYGKEYFARHGGKSVLIGRFVGPLRSTIPVIAGMMHMSHLRFYVANILSAIAWSLLYVMPGVLIGKASSELSPEIATRLFVLILLVLAGVWLLSLGLRWLLIRANRIMNYKFNHFWLWLMKNPYWGSIAKYLVPAKEVNHYPTAALFLLWTLSTILFCAIAVLVYYNAGFGQINQGVNLFFQSLRTGSFDIFFIILSQFISPLTLISLALAIALATIYVKDWRALAYWLSLCLISLVVLFILHLLIYSPRPPGILKVEGSSSFPMSGLTFITALIVTLILYINAYSKTRFKHLIKISIAFCLVLLGLSVLYLGDNWLTDILGAYLCGISLSLGHWLFYRRKKPVHHYSSSISLGILALVLLTTAISTSQNLKTSIRNHQPYFAQYVFSDELWWNQAKPLLPIYRKNRIGLRFSVFNIQYAGSLPHLEEALKNHGWQRQKDSLLNSLLSRVSNSPTASDLPLMAQLYLNKKPALVMTFQPSDGEAAQILRIWRSNYHLDHFKQPIWVGSVYTVKSTKPVKPVKSISYIVVALPESSFLQRSLKLPREVAKQKLYAPVEPELLLIKESAEENLD